MPTRLLSDGSKHRFLFWASREDDLNDFCNCPKVSPADKKKIVKAFTLYAANGFPDNREKFRPVEDKLYEIKVSAQLRMIGFFEGKSFIIVLCVRKKKNALSPQDVQKAKQYRDRYHEENPHR